MIIKCEKEISEELYNKILDEIKNHNLQPDILRDRSALHTPLIGLKGDCSRVDVGDFEKLEGVLSVQRISVPYKLASREYKPHDTVIRVCDVVIGKGNPIVFMAGPCAVESQEQIITIARQVKEQGAKILRGGAFKPRTHPRTFEGLKEEGLVYLSMAKKETGLPIVTEVMSPDKVKLVGKYADIFQVGARNMQNYDLLDELGKENKPVLLKRGIAATLYELLGAADRILEGGNDNVMLCLRGIRTFEDDTRFTYDIGAIPALRKKTHLPIIVDPSHAAGKKEIVPIYAKMAIVAGADGLIIETHYNPSEALCDAKQMVTPTELGELINYATKIRDA